MGKSYHRKSVKVILHLDPLAARVARGLAIHDIGSPNLARWFIYCLDHFAEAAYDTPGDLKAMKQYFAWYHGELTPRVLLSYIKKRAKQGADGITYVSGQEVPARRMDCEAERVRDEPGASISKRSPATEQTA